jgi:Sigma-70 region 2
MRSQAFPHPRAPATLETELFFHPKVRVEDFEVAAMPHFSDLYRTARLLAQDSAEAEDLVQEVYLQAWN